MLKYFTGLEGIEKQKQFHRNFLTSYNYFLSSIKKTIFLHCMSICTWFIAAKQSLFLI